MRHLLQALLLACILPLGLQAQPMTAWAKRFSVSTPILSFGKNLNAIAMDSDEAGNLYILGFHRASLLLDSLPISAPYSGAQTGFLLKMDPEGQVIWQRQLTMGSMKALVVRDGWVYVGGEIASAEFGLLSIQRDETGAITTLFAQGNRDGFVAKYSTEGELSWARPYGGIDSENLEKGDLLNALAVDAQGRIFITGSFHKSISFGNGLSFSEPSDRGQTFYLAMLSPEGEAIWARRIDSPLPTDAGNATGASLALSPDGRPAVAIAYSGGGLLLDGEVVFNNNPQGDRGCLLVQYDAQGERQWRLNIKPEQGLIAPFGLEADAQGRLYLGFSHERQVLVGENAQLHYIQTEDNLLKTGLVCLEADGEVRWAQTYFCSNGALSVQPNGQLFLAAVAFRNTVALSESLSLQFEGAGATSLWARFSPDGELVWAHQPQPLEAAPFSTNHNILAGPAGAVYATANFNQTLDFGNGWTLTNGYNSSNFDALYLIKLDDATTPSRQAEALPFRVFPNPAYGSVSVELPAPLLLSAYNLQGQRLAQWALPAGSSTLDLNDLPAGLIVLAGQHGQHRLVQRVQLFR